MTAKQIIEKYISFFKNIKGYEHKEIANSSLIPENDSTTLFTSSGMQPLVPYLLGEPHPMGKRLVNVQNCFRAVDIDEVGDNRHTTFFRMLGNWSLGNYFKQEEIPWLWELLTKEFGLPKEKLYVTVFDGDNDNGIILDKKAYDIWLGVLEKSFGASQKHRIFSGSVDKNWWSRSGTPNKMPLGEIGGPDTEVYYRFDELSHSDNCKGDSPVLCECGKYLEIANSVFMQYLKSEDGFVELPQKNIDYGGGLERLLAAIENQSDIFKTSLFKPIIESVRKNILTKFSYSKDIKVDRAFRIITDHLIASTFIINSGVLPSNKDRGSVLRRLVRRAVAQKFLWGNKSANFNPIIDTIITCYSNTDSELINNAPNIKATISEEEYRANRAIEEAFKVWARWVSDHPASGTFENALWGTTPFGGGGKMAPLSPEKMFNLYQSYGLSMDIIEEVTHGHIDKVGFEELLKKHKQISKAGMEKKFAGGLADHSEKTIMGHTATHLLHKALRDMFGIQLHQTGSNITSERVRFDFNFDRNLTPEELKKIEEVVNGKIRENLPVHFEMLPLRKAKEVGAIGLFNEKYQDTVKVYFVGEPKKYYSIEFCGGPHVKFTSEIKSFKIFKQENIGKGNRRIYAVVGN